MTSTLRRFVADWLTEGRLNTLEARMATSNEQTTAAFAELDAQLTALEEQVQRDDAVDAAAVRERVERIRRLTGSVNPDNPAEPNPGEPGAVDPVPAAEVSADLPVADAPSVSEGSSEQA